MGRVVAFNTDVSSSYPDNVEFLIFVNVGKLFKVSCI